MPSHTKIAMYQSRAMAAVKKNRALVRSAMSAGEVLAGAFAAGALDARVEMEILGMPVSSVVGVVTLVTGIALAQPDAAAVGLGMLAGRMYNLGQDVAETIGDMDERAAA